MNAEDFNKLNSRLDQYELIFLKNNEEIESIVDYWHEKSEKSPMYIDHPDYIMFKTPLKNKALKHYEIVKLFDYISQIDRKYFLDWDTYQLKYRGSIVCKTPTEKYIRLSERYNYFKAESEKILQCLEMDFSFDILYDDFYNDRILIKDIFKKIFLQYGIELSDFAIKIIFGRYKYDKDKFVDSIKILTYKTYFDKSLKDQFGFTYSSGYAKGIFSAFFMRASGLLNEEDNYYNYEQIIPSLYDPFLQERRIIKMFAKAAFLGNEFLKRKS